MSLRTLNADLMIINRRESRNKLDLSVTRRYFYAIKDISIGGQCICHGHAESCPPDPATGVGNFAQVTSIIIMIVCQIIHYFGEM